MEAHIHRHQSIKYPKYWLLHIYDFSKYLHNSQGKRPKVKLFETSEEEHLIVEVDQGTH